MISLAASRHYCRVITAEANSSFPLAFTLLPRPKRDAMTTLYAVLRLTDDLADEPGELSVKSTALQDWRQGLRQAARGAFHHPVHPAFWHLLQTFPVPLRYIEAVLDGVESDLQPRPFQTFSGDLYPYCWRVASAVGLACLGIWGLRRARDEQWAQHLAVQAGIAFQITNILRDLAEDQQRGRSYLPVEEYQQFNCQPGNWHAPGFPAFLRFQIDRARTYYQQAEPLTKLLPNDGRAVFTVMFQLYRRLLEEIEFQSAQLPFTRIRVDRPTKVWLFLKAWPIRWGLA